MNLERQTGFAPRQVGNDALAREGDIDRLFIDMVAILRRQARLILAVVIAALFAVMLYLALRPSQYRAVTTLLVDPARTNVLQSQQIMALPTIDSGTVDSQVEILKSDVVALNAVRRLKLADDPEFNRISAVRALFGPVLQFFLGSSDLSTAQVEQNTSAALQRKLFIQRAGVSYVIEVAFTSLDPDKAALIANTVADIFLDLNITTRFDAARRASRWLEERSEELRARVIKADEAVQSYRNQHGLVEAGGKLLIEQQMSELTAQISQLRAQTAEAQARYDQIGKLIASGDFDAGNIDVGPETVLGRLRQQASDLARREKELVQRFGDTHRLVLDARSELRSLRRQLTEEFGKLHESLRSSTEVASKKQKSAEAELKTLTDKFNESRDKEILLRELQRDANSIRQLFETFTNRHKEMMQQETLPLTDARIVAHATRPTQPSNPRLTLVLIGALGGGLLLGMAVALVRDRFDRKIRRLSDAEAATGHPVLAVLPNLIIDPARERTSLIDANSARDQEKEIPAHRLLPTTTGLLRYVVLHPFSSFAEEFRSLRISLLLNGHGGPKIVGITSTVPNEGKTVIANNFAQYMASTGARVLLLDGDMRNPTLSITVCPDETRGLPDILLGRAKWSDLIYLDPVTRLWLLPARSSDPHENVADMLSTNAFEKFIKDISSHFDMIVIDLAPVGRTFDARAISPFVDSFLYVVSWGSVDRDLVERTIASAPEVSAKISGIILNRVDESRMKYFDVYNKDKSAYGYGYRAAYPNT